MTERVTLTDAMLTEWRNEAEQHPSGQRCNGIHDATADRRVIVLIDRLRAAQADAWDEGYDARGKDIANEGLTYTELTPNPYRGDESETP